MSEKQATEELLNMGAVKEKKEDRDGKTKSGWWMDDMWLAPIGKPIEALRVLKGD